MMNGSSTALPVWSSLLNTSAAAASNGSGGVVDKSLPVWAAILLWMIMLSLSIVTIVGNALVCIAYYVDGSIRKSISNRFIISLAASDCVIGFEGYPFFTLFVAKGEVWTLGSMACQTWLFLDYSLCLVSILTVLLITIDRFLSVCHTASYMKWQCKKYADIVIAASWIIPALFFGLLIYGWEWMTGEKVDEETCYAPFLSNEWVNMGMYFTYYWSTLIAMFILYTGIHKASKKLTEKGDAREKRTIALLMGQRLGAQVAVKVMLRQQQEQEALKERSKNDIEERSSAPGDLDRKHQTEAVLADRDSGRDTGNEPNDEANHVAVQVAAQVSMSNKESGYTSGGTARNMRIELGGDSDPHEPDEMQSPDDVIDSSARSIGRLQHAASDAAADGDGGDGECDALLQHMGLECSSVCSSQLTGGQSLCQYEDADSYSLASAFLERSLFSIIHFGASRPQLHRQQHGSLSSSASASTRRPALMHAGNTSRFSPLLPRSTKCSPLLSWRRHKQTLERSLHRRQFARSVDRCSESRPPTDSTGAPSGRLKHSRSATQPLCSIVTYANANANHHLNGCSRRRKAQSMRVRVSAPRVPPPPPPSLQAAVHHALCVDRPVVEQCIQIVRLAQPESTTTTAATTPDYEQCGIDVVVTPTVPGPDHQQQQPPSSECSVPDTNLLLPCSQPGTPAADRKQSVDGVTRKMERRHSRSASIRNSIRKMVTKCGQVRVPNSDDSSIDSDDSEHQERTRKKSQLGNIASMPSAEPGGVGNAFMSTLFNPTSLFRGKRKKTRAERRAHKAFRTITFIVGFFAVLWSPYFIVATIYGFCHECIPSSVFIVCYYLCYINSAGNPFMYALANRQFKTAFTRILKGDLHRT